MMCVYRIITYGETPIEAQVPVYLTDLSFIMLITLPRIQFKS